MSDTTIVVPCYNEEARLDVAVFRAFASTHPSIRFLLVDDGSSDRTLDVLRELESSDRDHFTVHALEQNAGKAEAVRRGMVEAFAAGADYVGFWDADLATPLDAIPEFIEKLDSNDALDMVFGSRVKLLGRAIERNPLRHYLGRVFATVASNVLKLAIYDTQCGAKLFRNRRDVPALFDDPFITNWIFDVEILARFRNARRANGHRPPAESIYELPLSVWHDIAGSKVKSTDFLKAIGEMIRIRVRYG